MSMKRLFDDELNMPVDLREEFLVYLSQPDFCELFYKFMKSEGLSYVLEFYLACDGLKNLQDQTIKPRSIIELIYKHYLSTGKSLSTSSSKFSLPDYLLASIHHRFTRKDFHRKFYDQTQEYILKYMLQMCYPKYRIEQENHSIDKRSIISRRKKSHRNTFDEQNQSTNVKMIEYNLAQDNPYAFFQQLKQRLIPYQTKTRLIEDDPIAILDRQIEKTIDNADNYLVENDSGVGIDSSEKNFSSSIDVIWYPSLHSHNALLSTIPYFNQPLTFKQFRQLLKKQNSYRYFFKTICTPDINQEQYVYREITMDDELIPFYDGKIFVQLDRIDFK